MAGKQDTEPTSCKICKLEAKTTDESLRCDGPCQEIFLGNCLGLKLHQVKRIATTKSDTPWLCHTCKEERPLLKSAGNVNTTPTTCLQNENFQPMTPEMGIFQILHEIKEMKY
jgi:hypothetical protein